MLWLFRIPLKYISNTFLGPCPDIAGVYNDRIIRLDIENTFNGDYFYKNDIIIPFNGTIDKACNGAVIALDTYKKFGFSYSKDMCKISWSHDKVSIKNSCL